MCVHWNVRDSTGTSRKEGRGVTETRIKQRKDSSSQELKPSKWGEWDSHHNWLLWDFPGSPVVKNSPFNAGDTSSIPGWGPKLPHASGQLSLSHAHRNKDPVQSKIKSYNKHSTFVFVLFCLKKKDWLLWALYWRPLAVRSLVSEAGTFLLIDVKTLKKA